MKLLKNIINKENRTKIVEILTILILLWLVLYFIPEVFTSLFNTILGNLILVTISVLVLMYNFKYGITLSLILIVIYRFSQLSKTYEGFTWTSESTQDFLQIQNTSNRNLIFDVNIIQNTQARQQELDYFNKNGMWPWSQKTIDLYSEAINKNPYIRTYSGDAINNSRKIYNQTAILKIISYQRKEGKFLLNGIIVKDPSGNKKEELPNGYGEFAYNSGLMVNKDDVIKCNMNKDNGATLERIRYNGKGGIFGEQTTKTTPVDYNDLENIIPGFKFLNRRCNPCVAINENSDYSCPFQLKLKDETPFISNVWKYLWNIKENY